MNKNHVEKKEIPLYRDKVSITLEGKNDLILTNAYEQIVDLLNNQDFGQFLKIETSVEAGI